MRAFRMAVVMVVIAAIFSPAMGMAKTEQRTPPVAAQQVASTEVALGDAAARAVNAQTREASQYAQREQQSQGVRDFRGGAVYVYFGSGVVLALIIILLLLL
jgi:Flp pilus assembly protein TadB